MNSANSAPLCPVISKAAALFYYYPTSRIMAADQSSSFAQQVSDIDALLEDEEIEGESELSAPAPWRSQPQQALAESIPKSILDLQPLREQDRLLPAANVAHLMANELPPSVKVSKDTKCLMQEVLSEFIGFITSEANDVCLYGKQKAITQMDIMTALRNMGKPSNHSRHRFSTPSPTRPPPLLTCQESSGDVSCAVRIDLGEFVPPIEVATQHFSQSPRTRTEPSPKASTIQPGSTTQVSSVTPLTGQIMGAYVCNQPGADCSKNASVPTSRLPVRVLVPPLAPISTRNPISDAQTAPLPPLPPFDPSPITPPLPPPLKAPMCNLFSPEPRKTPLPLLPPLPKASSWSNRQNIEKDARGNEAVPFKRAKTSAFNGSDWIQSLSIW